MKKLLMTMAVFAAANAYAQTPELFQPYKATALRLPSVPLVVSDPYFSIWSPYDKLTDGDTRHWTNDEKPLEGLLRVDGVTYRFMGSNQRQALESIVPMADEVAWKAKYSRDKQKDGWQKPGFDESAWKDGEAAFGSPELSNVRTRWSQENSDLYVRRTVELTADDLNQDLYLVYSHDDVFEIYLNGTKVADTGETWREGVRLQLDSKLKALLKPGKNVIASHCHNTTGGAYTDFGLFKNLSRNDSSIKTAEQKSVDVLATSSYYTFTCGPVELDVVFTAPMLIEDYDLLSTPINYVSYQVRATDGKVHDVQFYLSANPLQSVNKSSQATVSSTVIKRGVKYVKTGTVEQPILAKKGDGICIDWGYFYLPNINGEVSLDSENAIKESFLSTGALPASKKNIVCRKASQMPTLAYVHNFGKVSTASSYALLGYDEIEDIEYMYNRYKGYWAHDGKVSIFDAFEKLSNNYSSIMGRCRQLDKRIYDDGLAAGDVKYAEILSASYRHVIAAHKLFQDKDGNLLFFSKENNSNGCVNTVDLTYPEAPLFLVYNPELQKAMMTSIFDYSLSGRWTKPFAAHDLGTYPIANGQVYGGDMPLEEAGNMITLAAMICKLEGNTNYVNKYWGIITTWVDYLVENGQDPANQLCTDDFAGHWAHNANLSIKAIMGVAGYAEMARIKGDAATADKYMKTAKDMAAKWEKDAFEKDHYRLAFDRKNTWSQKYNMVWDKLWKTNVFPNNAMEREVKYYVGKQNKYGLPLDSRKEYTKSDWIMWTAAMSPDNKTFQKFVDPLYTYINETPSRVPISDWHETKSGKMVGFKARSVIGGYWMKVLADKLAK
ncbi:MAG: glutaminase domain-containing protein [Prevotella sp.]